MVQQCLRGFCFRCSLTSFHPVSLYDIWPYMSSYCKYSGVISIGRNKFSVCVCMWLYMKILNMHTCIAYLCVYLHIYIYVSPENRDSWMQLGKQMFKNYTHSTEIAGEPSLQTPPSCKWLLRTRYLQDRDQWPAPAPIHSQLPPALSASLRSFASALCKLRGWPHKQQSASLFCEVLVQSATMKKLHRLPKVEGPHCLWKRQ